MVEKGNNFRETLSALVDGEVSEFELHRLLKSLNGDELEELREVWNRYNITSSVIRGETFSKEVDYQLRIADEVNLECDDQANNSWTLSGFARQFSVAASVAFITVVGVRQINLSWFDAEIEHTGIRHNLVKHEVRSEMQYPEGFKPRIDAQTVSTDSVLAKPDRWKLNLSKNSVSDSSSALKEDDVNDQVEVTSNEGNHKSHQKPANDMRQEE